MKTPEERTKRAGIFPRTLLFLAILPFAPHPVFAQSEEEQQVGSESVPARIRALEGSATLQRQQEQDRVEATINAPIFPGDLLQTEDGRAEVEFPDGSVLWLNYDTRVEFPGIGSPAGETRDNTVLRLDSGTLEMDYRGEGGSGEDPRVDTPEASVYLLGRGRFRVESDRGATTLVSLRGVAELAGDNGSVLVRSGQRSDVEGGETPDTARAINTLRLDDFDQWCEERQAGYLSDDDGADRQYAQAVPVPVRHYVTELDNYGDWQWTAGFGWVWRPTIYQVGWRPYVNGYWTWAPYGWSWVAYEPWGWVPYHYGRWSWVVSAGWVWIPGGVYSGAWVSWSVTPTYIGWCPLDYYNRPAYMNVNITNVTVNNYGGGWNFLPLNRFTDRNAARLIVKPDRVPNLHGAVTTRVLPHFSPEQARLRPDVSRQVLRESAKHQYRLEAPGQEIPESRVPFRQADRREERLQRQALTGRRSPAGRTSTPVTPVTPRGVSESKPRAGTGSSDRNLPGIQNPHATPGTDRDAAGRTSRGDGFRPAGERRRTTPVEGSGTGTVIRKEGQGRQNGTTVRPRREFAPEGESRNSQDASRRVLQRIFGNGADSSSGAPRPGVNPRQETRAPDRGRPSRESVQAPRQGASQPRVEAPRTKSQPSRQPAPPPPRKQEEKKDKP